jgi:hypothetical protein
MDKQLARHLADFNRLYQAAKNLVSQINKVRLTDDLGHDFERNIALIDFRRVLTEVEEHEQTLSPIPGGLQPPPV